MFPINKPLERLIFRLRAIGQTTENNEVVRHLVIEQSAAYFPAVGRGHGRRGGHHLQCAASPCKGSGDEHLPGASANAEEHLLNRRIIASEKKKKRK